MKINRQSQRRRMMMMKMRVLMNQPMKKKPRIKAGGELVHLHRLLLIPQLTMTDLHPNTANITVVKKSIVVLVPHTEDDQVHIGKRTTTDHLLVLPTKSIGNRIRLTHAGPIQHHLCTIPNTVRNHQTTTIPFQILLLLLLLVTHTM